MVESTYTKIEIAQEYLDTAMQLYIEQRNYFAIIHLAAAAEELFGKHLPEDERMYSMDLKATISLSILLEGRDEEIEYEVAHDPKGDKSQKAKQIILGPKNKIKHMNEGDQDRTVTIDPVTTARRSIKGALSNFNTLWEKEAYKLHLSKSPTMRKFLDYDNEEMQRRIKRPRSQSKILEA